MQRITFILVFLLYCCSTLEAQTHRGVCGNTYHDQMSQIERYRANLKASKNYLSKSRNAITYIPIQFHIIKTNSGSGGVTLGETFEQLCQLNTKFSEFDIIFYMAETPAFLDNDVIYNDHTLASGQFKMRQVRNREALNVWIVNNATPSSGGPPVGITLGYYDPTNDWIVIRRNEIIASNNTLAHEVGHFFSLFHPHLGWDSDPYSIEKHGNPVVAQAPGGGETELVDRSNCQDAGDMLCDTPPDYNFALNWPGCNFSADIKDPNGDRVDPDETLIMSYFSDECTSKFTDSQVALMLSDVDSPGRNFCE